MKPKKILKTALAASAALGVVAALWGTWQEWVRPTRIALLNYSDFQTARFLQSDESRFVRLDPVRIDDTTEVDLTDYDLVLSWSHGVPGTEALRTEMTRASAKGTAIYCVGATSAESDFTTLEGEDLTAVESYLDNGGKENFARLYAFVRARLHGTHLFAGKILPAVEIPENVYFHLDETYFATFSAFQGYRVKKGIDRPGAPRVVLLTSNLGPRNSGRSDLDSIIVALEARGMNVYPIDGFGKRLELIDSAKPQIVVSFPHGRFVPGQDSAAIAYLRARNIPLMSPIKVFQEHDAWMKDQRGMDGGVLGQNVVVPELDGAIEPFVTAAQYRSEDGGMDFRAIPGRAERLASRVANWLKLRTTPNKDKKVAIVYLKGPGKNALVAGGLEVLPSLYALLKSLRDSGYAVRNLPATLEEFGALVHRQGMVPGPYAKGAIETMLREGNPARIPATTYEAWAREALAPESWRSVTETYGAAPGPYLSVQEGDRSEILVNRIEFGNVAILPQPLPGYGENEFELVHGAHVPPPHPYIAAYLWAAKGFHADALVHFGTHGSFEFLPSRQVALSLEDWPDALVGDMPHGYVYVINNIGEAMMAKRRGYATMLSHLTPPFMASDLYADLQQLHDKVHHWLLPDLDAGTRSQYAVGVKELVLRLSMDKDLEFASLEHRDLKPEEMDRIHNHLHAIEQEKVGRGLYALGRPYTRAEADETATLMHVDGAAFSKAELDIQQGKISRSILDDKHRFEQLYREPALHWVAASLAGRDVLSTLLDPADRARMRRADSVQSTQTRSRRPGVGKSVAVDTARVASLLAEVASDTARARFVRGWSSKREFLRLSSLLDPAARARFDKIAGLIPAMKDLARMLDAPGVEPLLRAARDEGVRGTILSLLDDPAMQDSIRSRVDRRREELREGYAAPESVAFVRSLRDSAAWMRGLPRSSDSLQILSGRLSRLLEHRMLLPDGIRPDSSLLASRKAVVDDAAARTAAWEEDRLRSLRSLRDALRQCVASRDGLLSSTSRELAAVANMLSGGYIEPSSGGDPVSNPQSVPTGRNLYSINAESTPTKESWAIGKRMVDALLARELAKQGRYPRKVALTLWGGEFVRDQGTTLAQALHLMGVEPVWNTRGRMHDVKLVQASRLGRPRIDVVVQTSGQFRDMGASRLYLINKAVRLASEAPALEDGHPNHVRTGSKDAEAELLKVGAVSPERAARISRVRTFGGVNGNYGTGIMGMVESGSSWDSTRQIEDRYIANMGAMYDEQDWGAFEQGAFTAALRNTEVVLQSRSSNTTGPLSLDHTYEFMGGLNAAVRRVTGKDPRAFFTDTRNHYAPVVQDAKEAVWVEARSTVLNPKYVREMMQEGETAAEGFAETFRNTYGWEVMKPDLVDDALWESYYAMFVEDHHRTGVREFLDAKNPYAYQEMTATMLETVRKGYWKAPDSVVKRLSEDHADQVARHGAGCSGFVCDNPRLKEFIEARLSGTRKEAFQGAVAKALATGGARNAMKMEKQELGASGERRMPQGNTVFFAIAALLLALGGVAIWILWKRRNKGGA